MSLIFGPVNSRRFGLSLGVDLSPLQKTCNYDCIYCELKAAKPVAKPLSYPKPLEVIEAILAYKGEFELLSITANGEPSLYPELKELIKALKLRKFKKPILILSNGTGVLNNYQALLDFDIVKLSIDSVNLASFKKINRPFKDIDLALILKEIKRFSLEFKGELILESLFIKGINDSDEDVFLLNESLKDIRASRLDISTLDRPPAYPCKGLEDEELEEIAKKIKALPVLIAKRKDEKRKLSFSKKELLKLLSLRPTSSLEIQSYDRETKLFLKELLAEKKVELKRLGSLDFYKALL